MGHDAPSQWSGFWSVLEFRLSPGFKVTAYVPEQHLTVSTFLRNSRSLRMAILQADVWPIPILMRC